ncbi:MAG: sensor histidine kinase [Planctomycetes bacterium]|nr:sensor histidine kinase [Planctomycetota bacterium]
MSLRARILLSIAVVNLAVTALLAIWMLDDLRERDEAAQQKAQERESRIFSQFEAAFDGYLSVDLRADERKGVAKAIQQLRFHPLTSLVHSGFIREGLIWKDSRVEPSAGSVPSDALLLNFPGAKRRSPGFSVLRAQRLMVEAIDRGTIVRDPLRHGYVAAPIRSSASDGRRPDAPIWGAGYFLLDVLAEPELTPSFQPRTLLLGMGAGTFLLLAFTWFLLERSVLQPLAELSAGAARVAVRAYETPVPGAGGDEIGAVVSSFNEMMGQVRDADARLSERVAEATRRAEEHARGLIIAQRLAATGTLASGIAHEINNPLGGMLNAALRLKSDAEREGASGAPRVRYLRLLVDGLMRIQGIVKRVLHFTPRHVDPVVVSVLEIVRRAVAFTDHPAKRAGVEIVIAGDELPVLVEPGEMQQVFLNLLLNAVDAIAAHAKRGRITVSAVAFEGRARVIVADDGPGMTLEQQERCFDLFFTTKDPGKGTGLGLSVAHHIVLQHGGSLSVASTAGAGTAFTVSLPLGKG